MAQIFLFLTLALSTLTAWAAETITIMSPYSASHSGTPAETTPGSTGALTQNERVSSISRTTWWRGSQTQSLLTSI